MNTLGLLLYFPLDDFHIVRVLMSFQEGLVINSPHREQFVGFGYPGRA
jgi:hypothetical protein